MFFECICNIFAYVNVTMYVLHSLHITGHIISVQWIPGGSHGFHRVSTGFPHDFRKDLEAVADELLRRGLATPGQVQIMFDC